MSKKAATIGDIGTDHEGAPPTPIMTGSQDIIIDNKSAARVGDKLAPHAKPGSPPHDRTITTGSSTVFFNGKPAAITGSAVGCGGVIIGGSSVIIGDQAPAEQSNFIPRITPWFDTHIRLLGATGKPLANFKFTYTDDTGKTHRAMTGADGVAAGIAKSQKPQQITVEGSSKSWLAKGK